MGETRNTPEQQIEGQRKTIVELTQRVKDLEIWERFAAYLVETCDGHTITPENLTGWMEAMLSQEAPSTPVPKGKK